MDGGEIFGATLLAIAAIGCITVISFTLAMNTHKFVNKTLLKKQAMRKKSESTTRIKL